MAFCKTVVLSALALATAASALATTPEPRLSRIRFSPENPKQGDVVTAFIEAQTPYNSPAPVDLMLNAKVDGTQVSLLHPADTLWIAQLGPYSVVSKHTVDVETFIVDSAASRDICARIAQLDTDIANLNSSIASERDPDKRSSLQTQLALKTSQRTQLLSQLMAQAKSLGVDSFNLSVNAATDMDALLRSIMLAQNRSIFVQNVDGGYDFDGTPDSHRDTTNASLSNMFGVPAVGPLNAYSVTKEPAMLVSAKKTGEALMAIQVSKTNRIFAPDAEFLMKAAIAFGFSSYRTQGLAGHQAERDFTAAMFVLNNFAPTNDQINSVTQAQLDAVTDAQRISALRQRFINNGRNPGLRAYDFNSRIKRAQLAGDTSFAKAIADAIAADFSGIVPTAQYYLLGLSNTISALLAVNPNDAGYAAVIAQARSQMLALQGTDGFFRTPSTGINPDEGTFQDQGFTIQALLDAGDVVPLSNLLSAIYSSQAAFGGWVDSASGNEYMEASADLIDAMTNVWKANTGNSFAAWLIKSAKVLGHTPGRLKSSLPPARPQI